MQLEFVVYLEQCSVVSKTAIVKTSTVQGELILLSTLLQLKYEQFCKSCGRNIPSLFKQSIFCSTIYKSLCQISAVVYSNASHKAINFSLLAIAAKIKYYFIYLTVYYVSIILYIVGYILYIPLTHFLQFEKFVIFFLRSSIELLNRIN